MKNIFLLLLVCGLSFDSFAQKNRLVNPADVTIARDAYGVPHIFAKTDAGAAYGLAYSNAEDRFEDMQELLLSGKAMMGRDKGVDGAAIDFFVHTIGAKQIVKEKYDKEITPEYDRYLRGYSEGVNDFAKQHPERVRVKKAFPLDKYDILQSFIVAFSALTGVSGEVERAYKGHSQTPFEHVGSNAFAIDPTRTVDGNTYLCINPHFLIEGGFSFYEAHIQSDEGLNVTGTLFQGGPSIFMGNNEHLGWAKTYNYFDGSDVYELEMNPKKKLQYRYDGEWKKLEKRPVWLKVKIGPLVIPVRRKAYWSVYGPTLKGKNDKFYSIKALAYQTIQAGQQYYEMDKATDITSFKKALDRQGISMFNIVYADKEGNIYYVSNGLIPDRPDGWDWNKVLPGNTSKNNWERGFSVAELPHVENPDCGFVFNTNNSPFLATCEGENDDRNRLPAYVDKRPGNNNRALRFLELIQGKDKFSFEDFKGIKFDANYPAEGVFMNSVKLFFSLDASKYPDIAEGIKRINRWDRSGEKENIDATMVVLALDHIFSKRGLGDASFVSGLDNLKEEECVEAIRHATQHLNKYFGTLDVAYWEINRFYKNGKDYPSAGFPDMLNVGYGRPHSDGKMKLQFGDTYIHFVSFSKDGPERIETLLPYGMTGEDVKQLELYNKKQPKKMSLDKEEILREAVRIYHPGE